MSKVLIIQDQDDKILSKRLSTASIEAFFESSAQTACQTAEKILPNLILLDLIIKGKEGVEILKQLKSNPKTKNIPVIAYTNLSEEAGYPLAMNNGAYDYIIKNHRTIDQLVQMIKLFIEETS